MDILEHMLLDQTAEPTDLPLSLLQKITHDFSDDQQIGTGGFAVVYKGILQNGVAVVVKKLRRMLDIDEKKFNQEVQCLMKTRHKNVVHFLGYCVDTQGKMMQYEGKFVMVDLCNRLLSFEYVPTSSKQNKKSMAIDQSSKQRRKFIKRSLHMRQTRTLQHLSPFIFFPAAASQSSSSSLLLLHNHMHHNSQSHHKFIWMLAKFSLV